MVFSNITDGEANAILANYERANGRRDEASGERDWDSPDSNSGAMAGVTNEALRLQRVSATAASFATATPNLL